MTSKELGDLYEKMGKPRIGPYSKKELQRTRKEMARDETFGQWTLGCDPEKLGNAVVGVGSTSETFGLPCRLVNGQNVREHWSEKSARAKMQRQLARDSTYLACVNARLLALKGKPLSVTITRIGKRRMDKDGNVSACKHIQDGVADGLNIDDGSELVTWEYEQELAKEFGVRVTIKARGE